MTDTETITARFLAAVHQPSARPGPDRLSAACVAVLPAQHAAIMIWLPDSGWDLLGASDTQAAQCAQVQVAAGEGPGPQAYLNDAPLLVPDYGAALAGGQWPLLAASGVAEHGGAVFAFPLHQGAIRIGTLDLYTDTPMTLDRTGFDAAVQVSELITVILLATLHPTHPQTGDTPAAAEPMSGLQDTVLGSWWEPAASTREIHQATGMVAAQLRCDVATAYARLVAHAVGCEQPLADVAVDVLARRLRFAPGNGIETSPGRH
ncbi:GAF and ANTAR domain-containing protein [Nocardia sp. NPDC051321]|uniref:GAF and ANTAR domain-containing protein n=1 Tax=Nocardia sp. NPDC051321 TaxID=3364323 RepID=UPI0037958606